VEPGRSSGQLFRRRIARVSVCVFVYVSVCNNYQSFMRSSYTCEADTTAFFCSSFAGSTKVITWWTLWASSAVDAACSSGDNVTSWRKGYRMHDTAVGLRCLSVYKFVGVQCLFCSFGGGVWFCVSWTLRTRWRVLDVSVSRCHSVCNIQLCNLVDIMSCVSISEFYRKCLRRKIYHSCQSIKRCLHLPAVHVRWRTVDPG
jgi:hypothetical protein